MTLDNMTGITEGSYTVNDMFCRSQLITCNRVKECNGVCPFEDALKHADKTQTMKELHIIDHDIVYCKDCVYCTVQNTKYNYAICQRHRIKFKPFGDDTRTHFCAWGERRKP